MLSPIRAKLRSLGIRVEARLGRGISGEVYRARTASSERIAIKICHPSPAGSRQDHEFRTEYDRHSRLLHPHIVAVRSFLPIDDAHRAYTMELIDAVPLAEVRARGGMEALAEVTLGVAGALEFAHARGILHGDLKPAHVLVEMSGASVSRVALADFGCARDRGRETADVAGTPAYWSPEQIHGWAPDERSDLWALGVLLYETISGRLPFGEDETRTLRRPDRAPSLAPFVDGTDPRWAGLIESLLQPDRDRRPPSARAVMHEVAAITGRSRPRESARPPGVLGPTLRMIGRDNLVAEIMGEPLAGRLIVLSGETGVGKTRLLDEIAREGQLESRHVVRADVRESLEAPFRLFRRVRDGGTVRNLVPDLSAREPLHEGVRDATLGSVVDQLAGDLDSGVARLFLFDSVELADDDTLEILLGLTSRVAGTGSRIIVAVDRAAPRVLGKLEPRGLPLGLPPLERDAIREMLVAHLARGSADDRAVPLDAGSLDALTAWMLRETGGVPAAIERALDGFIRDGHLHFEEEAWTLTPGVLERISGVATPAEAADRALASVGDSLRELLRFAALLGPEFDSTLLSIHSGNGADPVEFLGAARGLGLLGDSPAGPPRVRFRTPGLAPAIAETMRPEARRDLHARIAAALRERDPVPVTDLAYHLERGGMPDRAAQALVEAAAAASRAGAHGEAVDRYAAAWALLSAGDGKAIPMFAADWCRDLYLVGRFADVVRMADDFLRDAPPPRTRGDRMARSTLGTLRAYALLSQERPKEAADALLALSRCRPRSLDPDLLATVAWLRGKCHRRLQENVEARRLLEEARDVATRNELPLHAGRAEADLSILAWRENHLAEGLALARAAEASFARAGARDLLPVAWAMQAICHWYMLEPEPAAALHRRSAEEHLRRHRRPEAARSYQNLAHILTEQGRWAEAESALEVAGTLVRDHARIQSFLEYGRTRLALYRGRMDAAKRHATRMIDLAEQVGDPLVTIGHTCLAALVELEAGHVEDAAGLARNALAEAERENDAWGIAKSLYLLGSSRLALGRAEEALEHLDRAARIATDEQQPVALFRVELERARVRATLGQVDGAAGDLAAARALQLRSGSPFWDGLVCRAAADVHRLGGRNEAALSMLEQAYDRFTALGAERWRADTLRARAEGWLRAGQVTPARAAYEDARRLCDSLGLPPPSPLPGLTADAATPLESATRQLGILDAIIHRLLSPGEVDDVLTRVLEGANTLLGTERGAIAFFVTPDPGKPANRELRLRVWRGIEGIDPAGSIAMSLRTLAAAAETGESIVSNDALEDARLRYHESVRTLRIRSVAAIPLRGEGETIGSLYVDHRSQPGLFPPDAVRLVEMLANLAAARIQLARGSEIQESRVRHLEAEVEGDDLSFPDFCTGRHRGMRDGLRRAVKAARDGRTILLTGETGVGKDLIASLLHRESGRAGPFVSATLTSSMATLSLADLFGVAPRSATGVGARGGAVAGAHGGTLYLNEIGEIPADTQKGLIQFLDNGTYKPVGSDASRKFDGLVICATNADLEKQVAEGSFRRDVYFRLRECVFHVPPLRERIADLPALTDWLLERIARAAGYRTSTLHPDARRALAGHSWPGNVRELRTTLRNAIEAAGPGALIESVHLGLESGQGSGQHASRDPRHQEFEARNRIVGDTLQRNGGSVAAAARELGVQWSTLRGWITACGLEHLIRPGRGRRASGKRPRPSGGSER